MREFGERFNHNLHALRIVERFEQRYLDYPGLNLTFEVREGIIKHSRDYSASEFPELAEYLLDQRPPLEAQLIDHVDEIAYNTADLDDGFEAHLLDFEQLRGEVAIFDAAFVEVDRTYPNGLHKLKFNEALKRVLDRLATDLIENTRRQVKSSGAQTVEEIRVAPKRLASFSAEVARAEWQNEAVSFLTALLFTSDCGGSGPVGCGAGCALWIFHGASGADAEVLRGTDERGAAASSGLRLHCGDDGSFLVAAVPGVDWGG